MSGLGEYLEALKMQTEAFKQGVTQLATQQAVNDATRKLQDLNQQQLDEKQRLMANQQVGNELALRLTGVGAQPGQVAQATSGLLQDANVMGQNVATAERQADQQDWQSGENALQRASNERIAGIRSTGKNSGQLGTFIKGAQSDFDKLAKGPREMLAFANIAQKALDPKNPILDAAVVNFMARSSGEKGPLTEADKAPFGGSQAYDAKAKQFLENAKKGTLTDDNRAFLRQAVTVFGASGKQSLKDFRSQIAARSEKVAQARGFDLNANQIGEMLMVEEMQQASPNQARIDAIKAARDKVMQANPNDPRIKAANAKIIDLGGQP